MADVTDDFNRANGSLGTNWVDSPSFTGLTIVSNTANSATAAWRIAYWNPASNTFSNDQHAQVTAVTNAASQFIAPVVRHQVGTSSGYMALTNLAAGQMLLYRIDPPSTFTLLVTGAAGTVNPGDILLITTTGTTITGFINGVSQVTTTDTTYTSGVVGIAANNASLDNFAGGPIFGATTLMGAMWQ